MTDHDRGAYTPQTDAPLAFDARQARGGGRAFPMTLVVSVGVLAVLIVAIVLFYRSGVRGAGQAPLPVGNPVAEIKTPAPKEAQSSDEAAGLQIYKTEGAPAAAPAAPVFTAPPEEPRARPTTPVAAQPLPPAPAAAAVAASGATGPAQPAAKDAIGDLLDKSQPAAAKPVKTPKVVVASATTSAVVAAAAPAKAAATPAPTTTPATGAVSAQIGAYSSQELAAKGWSDIAVAFAGDMAGKGKHFEPVAKDGKTLYRATVTGFASKTAAQAFCAKLKAAARACIVK